MTVHVLNEEEEHQQPRLRLVPPEPQPKTDATIAAVGVLTGLAHILAARFILLLVCCGAFGLGLVATLNGQTGSIVASSLFDGLVLIPVVMLAWRRG